MNWDFHFILLIINNYYRSNAIKLIEPFHHELNQMQVYKA